MIEVLITIVITAFGLLGLAGLQAFSLKNSQSSSQRLVASALATDITDRLRTNYQGVINGAYNKPNVTDYQTAVASCTSVTGCTSAELAQNDLYEWQRRVAAALPNGVGVVCVDSTPHDGATSATPLCDDVAGTLYAVKIWWTDDRNRKGATASATMRFSTAFNP